MSTTDGKHLSPVRLVSTSICTTRWTILNCAAVVFLGRQVIVSRGTTNEFKCPCGKSVPGLSYFKDHVKNKCKTGFSQLFKETSSIKVSPDLDGDSESSTASAPGGQDGTNAHDIG